MSTAANTYDTVRPIHWVGDALELLDQRALPHKHITVRCTTAEEVATAIRNMVVRGAPAIGISASWGICLAAQEAAQQHHDWQQQLTTAFTVLEQSRPTAVNLFWALERMKKCLAQANNPSDLIAEAKAYMAEDLAANQRIGDFGASLIQPNSGIYTHCNTGSLATAGYGTALGVIRSAWRDGLVENIFAGETRPWLQGARLTAWELMQDSIPVQLSCEGAAGQLLRSGRVQWICVGADRITANGDTANKIGTYNLAVLAKHHGVRFMVAAHTSTIDLKTSTGDLIPIEERPAHEVTSLQSTPIAPNNCAAINPSFDVTPAELIDALVTEHGVVQQPNAEKIAHHLSASRP